MGNCTSKKSSKLPKFSLQMKPSHKAMDKETAATKGDARGLSTKIAPCTRGEATSFGFKRRPASILPMPVQLTPLHGIVQDPGSGSSVESLCHVAQSSAAQIVTNRPASTPNASNKRNSPAGSVNRFGFRSATPPRSSNQSVNRLSNGRSKSEGPKEAREAFFRPLLQPSGSANSVLNESRTNVGSNSHQFTLKTTQLPKPQFPVRLSEKAAKTVTNYCRRDGRNDSGASKEPSLTEDSGICSNNSGNNLGDTDTLHELEFSDSSPTANVRGRSFAPRKLEMRVVSTNKFELIDKNVGTTARPTEIIRGPRNSVSTGLVQQRTEQYLQRIAGIKDTNLMKTNASKALSPATSPQEGAESEEDKVKKDTNKSEKNQRVMYLMDEGAEDNDDLLPGEAMADDISFSLSSDDEISSVEKVNRITPSNAAGSAIRVDAIKLSNQLKKKTTSSAFAKLTKEDSSYGLFNAEDKTALEEDTLLDLSTESDITDDKDKVKEKIEAELNGSAVSADTPSNGSLSEGRDFLIDDEIEDQPQLCFSTHEDGNIVGSGNNNGSEGTVLATSQGFAREEPVEKRNREVRRTSVGTLSPCESLLSDDLMMDFDAEDNADTCAHNAASQLGTAIFRDDLRKSWATLPRSSPGVHDVVGTRIEQCGVKVFDSGCKDPLFWIMANQEHTSSPFYHQDDPVVINGKGLNGVANSESSSPQSHRSAASRASTEEDLSIRVDKGTYHNMFQDIVSIKSMLLKLNRILSESEGAITPYTEEDSTMDLKKQVAFLQQQLQQRETSLHTLQAEVNRKVNCTTQNEARTLCNAATQTDRVRPVSTGPSLLQNLPSDANIVTNGRCRKMSESLEEGTRLRSLPADTIMEKVKALSFKPVDVVEHRPTSCKNVFKITKIDLVLKSDNYGQKELRKT